MRMREGDRGAGGRTAQRSGRRGAIAPLKGGNVLSRRVGGGASRGLSGHPVGCVWGSVATCTKVPRVRDAVESDSISDPNAFFWVLETDADDADTLLHNLDWSAEDQTREQLEQLARVVAEYQQGRSSLLGGSSFLTDIELESQVLKSKLLMDAELMFGPHDADMPRVESSLAVAEGCVTAGAMREVKRMSQGEEEMKYTSDELMTESPKSKPFQGISQNGESPQQQSVEVSCEANQTTENCSLTDDHAAAAVEGLKRCGSTLLEVALLLRQTAQKSDSGQKVTDEHRAGGRGGDGRETTLLLLSSGAPPNPLKNSVEKLWEQIASVAVKLPPSFLHGPRRSGNS